MMDDGWNDEDDEMLDDDYSCTTWKGSMAVYYFHYGVICILWNYPPPRMPVTTRIMNHF